MNAHLMPRPVTLAVLPLLLAACERQPVAPDRVSSPQFQAIRSETTTILTFVDDPSDCTANPKIGEVLLFSGQLTYLEHTTTSGSGNTDVSWYLIYDPAVHLVGQTSGTVWMIDPTSTHPTGHDNTHGDGLSSQGMGDENYTSANGAHLHLSEVDRLTLNANGNITATRDPVW